MINYTKPTIWNTVWNRPYKNYEKHHQTFWEKIRSESRGDIVDLGCGSASCWNGYSERVVAVDFSKSAILEAKKHIKNGEFYVCDLTKTPLDSNRFDTVVLSGIINYYHDVSSILNEAYRLAKDKGTILITINVIKDFPDRTWTEKLIIQTFLKYGSVESLFYPKIGWFVKIKKI